MPMWASVTGSTLFLLIASTWHLLAFYLRAERLCPAHVEATQQGGHGGPDLQSACTLALPIP